MEQVDRNHCLCWLCQLFRPIVVSHIQSQGSWHFESQLLVANPRVDAAAMLRIGITALPGELWKAFLEGDAVLAGPTGDFKNQSFGWELLRQHISNRDAVALGCREDQAFIAEAGIHAISAVGFSLLIGGLLASFQAALCVLLSLIHI